ncbi:tetratricopeptide repeat protein [Candidatus Saganbacteria bacterium]|nr:tetratricopeptide repeat protein [Candidatus Saganbacteria bacterium]
MITELEELTKTLQSNPRNSKLLRQLGYYYLKNGYYKQARDEYHLAGLFSPRMVSEIMLDHEKVISENPSDIQARLTLISFCLGHMDLDSATLELEELLEINPRNVQAYNVLGKILIKLERIDEAMSLLEKAFDLGAKDLSISEMLASVYLEKGRFEEAIHFFEALPVDKKNLRTLAELYARIGKFENSAEKYFKMYELDSEVAQEVQMKLEELLVRNIESLRIRELLSEIYAKTLKPDLAVQKFSEIIKISPKKNTEVITKLKQLLKSYPLNPEATLALAENLSKTGSYSEAIEEYYKLVKDKPDLTDKAIAGCRLIIEQFPEQYLARQFLIETYINQGRIKDAAGEIKSQLRSYPDSADWIIGKLRDHAKKHPELRESLGYAYLAKSDFTLASAEAETLLSQNKQNIGALLLLGEILLKQKQCRKAVDTLHKALELSPYDTDIHEKFEEAKMREYEIEALTLKKRISEDEWKVSLHIDLGKNAISRGDRDCAIRELQASSKDTQKASYVFGLLGQFYRNEGLYDQSLDAFRKALQFANNESSDQLKKAKFGMALTYEAQGQIKYAVKLLEEIEQEDIDFSGLREKIRYLKNTSLSSIQNKSIILAIKDFKSGLLVGMWGRESKKTGNRPQLSVSFGQNYNNSGIEFFLKGMNQAAEEEFNLSSQLDPHYTAGVNNLAAAQMLAHKGNEGLNNFRRAYEVDSAAAIVLNNLGIALMLNGDLPDARIKLVRAAELDPELSAAKLSLGDVYYRTNRVKDALELYKQINRADLLYDIAQKRLAYKLP